jgi:hypothetical protein
MVYAYVAGRSTEDTADTIIQYWLHTAGRGK